LFWAVEYVTDRTTKAPFDPALKLNARIKAEGMARGLAFYAMPGTIDGRVGDHNMLAPPFICSNTDIDRIIERFGDAIDAVLKSLPLR
jgi:adenosylmethionine-8-amino-7-oxononanoate aminotransferase